MRIKLTKTVIIIPVVNELINIKKILKKIWKNYSNYTVLIIDDDSNDGTKEWINSLNNKKIIYMRRNKKFGVGDAHTTGILWSYKNKFSKVVTMDGDLSHNPYYIKKFIEKSKLNYEFIVSNRYNKKINHYRNWPFIKKLINKFGRLIIIILFNIRYDITTGFRLYDLKKIPKKNFLKLRKFKDYEFFIVSGIIFTRKFKVSEVLINMPYRGSGNSKMAFKHLLIWFLTIFKFRIFGLYI